MVGNCFWSNDQSINHCIPTMSCRQSSLIEQLSTYLLFQAITYWIWGLSGLFQLNRRKLLFFKNISFKLSSNNWRIILSLYLTLPKISQIIPYITDTSFKKGQLFWNFNPVSRQCCLVSLVSHGKVNSGVVATLVFSTSSTSHPDTWEQGIRNPQRSQVSHQTTAFTWTLGRIQFNG